MNNKLFNSIQNTNKSTNYNCESQNSKMGLTTLRSQSHQGFAAFWGSDGVLGRINFLV